jgi:hypothetical protein
MYSFTFTNLSYPLFQFFLSFFQFIDSTGTLTFLQEQYHVLIMRELEMATVNVNIGGDPTVRATIVAYMELIFRTNFPSELEV